MFSNYDVFAHRIQNYETIYYNDTNMAIVVNFNYLYIFQFTTKTERFNYNQ